MAQILGDRGLNLNQVDTTLATPLHICAEKNLARPVRMLVDAGADVNARHGRTSLTPLLMACNQAHPDVETIRSFLDKGAYPNWRDVQGRTAFSLIMYNQVAASRVRVPRVGLEDGGWNTTDRESEIRESTRGNRWRDMDDTIEEVGDWATKALPALLEITKRGEECVYSIDSYASILALSATFLQVADSSSKSSNVFDSHLLWRSKRRNANGNSELSLQNSRNLCVCGSYQEKT